MSDPRIILKGMLSMGIVAILYLIFLPITSDIVYDLGLWGDVEDPRAHQVKDFIYLMMQGSGVIIFFIIIIGMINSSTRKSAVDEYR